MNERLKIRATFDQISAGEGIDYTTRQKNKSRATAAATAVCTCLHNVDPPGLAGDMQRCRPRRRLRFVDVHARHEQLRHVFYVAL